MVNIKSDTIIELLNTQTSLTLEHTRTKLIQGKQYSQIRKIEENQEVVNELFSVFSKRFVENKMVEWEKKNDYEKTSDWKLRVNEESKKEKLSDLMEEAIVTYAESEMANVMGKSYSNFYFYSTKCSGNYDADKEIYNLKVSKLGLIKIPVSLDEAKAFDEAVKSHSIGRFTPFDMVFFIKDDKLALAEAKFKLGYINENIYTYINPDAKNRKKTKKEIERENKQQAFEQLSQANKYYNDKDYKQAIDCYQKVISLSPDIMAANNYKALGYAFFFTEDYSQVINSFKKALALDLIDGDVYLHLGHAYNKLKDYSNAIDAYNKSIRFMHDAKSCGVIYNLIGQAYYDSKDFTNLEFKR